MTDVLPAAQWMAREDLCRLVAALGDENVRYVGGAVRDTLLGLDVKDVDIATRLLPDVVMERLNAAKIRSIPTGIAHGTVTAPLPGGPVEITTLRRDVGTDGRRATVAFATDWRDDAARRDFTINALYADPVTRTVHDYFGGLADLMERRVRFIGDAHERIREDHLRILRFFRFQARFGAQPADIASENACAELAATLKGLSRERIGMELLNLLGLPNPAPTVARMAELGVLQVVLPEGDPPSLALLIEQEQRHKIGPDALRRLAALLPPNRALGEQVAGRFRLSTAQKKRLASAGKREATTDDVRALAYRIGMTQALDRILLSGTDAAPLKFWDIPRLPLKGGEIVAKGVVAGPDVARIMRVVENRWIAEGFPDETRVQQLLDEEIAR